MVDTRVRFLGHVAAALCAGSATSAFAEEGGSYFSVRAGGVAPVKLAFDVGESAAVTKGVAAKSGVGAALNVEVGYEIGPLRVGTEIAKRQSWLQNMTTTVAVPVSNDTTPKTAKGNFPKASGSVAVRSAMFDFEYEFKRRGDLAFYAGAGIGAASVQFRRLEAIDGVLLLNGKRNALAQQLVGGARYRLTSQLAAELRYSYFHVDRVSIADTQARAYFGGYVAHGGTAGLSYRF